MNPERIRCIRRKMDTPEMFFANSDSAFGSAQVLASFYVFEGDFSVGIGFVLDEPLLALLSVEV